MSDVVGHALVTGGNRGIGLAVSEQLAQAGLRVLLASRDLARGERAAAALRASNLDVRAVELDVEDERSVSGCAARLHGEGVGVDVLVNNAGVLFAKEDVRDPLQVSDEVVRRSFDVNFHGPWRVCRAFVGGMAERGYGRVVNVSSLCGSMTRGLSIPTCGAAYSSSKAALNSLTLALAASVTGDVKVNSVCPGYVRTDMGLATGEPTMQPADAAEWIVQLATLDADGPTGGFFQHGAEVPW